MQGLPPPVRTRMRESLCSRTSWKRGRSASQSDSDPHLNMPQTPAGTLCLTPATCDSQHHNNTRGKEASYGTATRCKCPRWVTKGQGPRRSEQTVQLAGAHNRNKVYVFSPDGSAMAVKSRRHVGRNGYYWYITGSKTCARWKVPWVPAAVTAPAGGARCHALMGRALFFQTLLHGQRAITLFLEDSSSPGESRRQQQQHS